MKKILRYIAKVIISGALAVAILSVFCYFFDNSPSAVEQPLYLTNYHYSQGAFWSDMQEGAGFGVINNMGYNGLTNYDELGTPVIAFLGSSHTEAFQLPQKQQYVSLVQQKFLQDDNAKNDYQCLNLGASSHYLKTSVSNFDYVASYFDNLAYVVVEVNDVEYSPEEFQAMLNGEYHEPLKKDGLMHRLVEKVPILRIPLLRTLKKQCERVERAARTESDGVSPIDQDYDAYRAAVDNVVRKLALTAAEKQFKLVFVYHYGTHLDDQLGMVRIDDVECVRVFSEVCQAYNVRFIDVIDDFILHYQNTNETPRGFANTAMNEGHTNAVGHSIIAEVLYNTICELEEGK